MSICSQNVCSRFWCPSTTPLPTERSDGFRRNFLLRTSNRIAITQPKLQTDSPKIANKLGKPQMGVKNVSGELGGGTSYKVCCPKPLLEASESETTFKWDWSALCPFPLRKMTGCAQTEGGEHVTTGGGPKPSPEFSTRLCRSLTNRINVNLETSEAVLNLYSDEGMFPFLLCGAQKKNLVEN